MFRTGPAAPLTPMLPLVVSEPERVRVRVRVPALTLVVPFQVFAAPEIVSLPFPALVRP